MLELGETIVSCADVSVFYGDTCAINNISIDIEKQSVTAFIGPSGCGKSTFLRTINRMNDTIEGCYIQGRVTVDGDDIYSPTIDVVPLRAKVGWFFKNPIPFQNQFMKMLPMAQKSMGWRITKIIWTKSLKRL